MLTLIELGGRPERRPTPAHTHTHTDRQRRTEEALSPRRHDREREPSRGVLTVAAEGASIGRHGAVAAEALPLLETHALVVAGLLRTGGAGSWVEQRESRSQDGSLIRVRPPEVPSLT